MYVWHKSKQHFLLGSSVQSLMVLPMLTSHCTSGSLTFGSCLTEMICIQEEHSPLLVLHQAGTPSGRCILPTSFQKTACVNI